jgi:FkbM family methyltransferase
MLDAILSRIMGPSHRGQYIDIGAAHPVILSHTKSLYQSGWRGINVEPRYDRYQLFLEVRPEDTNLNSAVGARRVKQEFLDCGLAVPQDSDPTTEKRLVELLTGDEVLAKASGPVDLLVVHADGFEEEVLGSMNLRLYKPKVVIVDAMRSLKMVTPGPWATEGYEQWEYLLLSSGYHLTYSNGIDRFYVRDDFQNLPPPELEYTGSFHRPSFYIRKWILSETARLEHAHAEETNMLRLAHQKEIELLEVALFDKERTILEQGRALNAYRQAYYPLSLVLPALRTGIALFKRAKDLLRPRLGNLRQYQPRDLWVPPHYFKSSLPTCSPRILLVTPSFQQGQFIELTMRSVLDQGYPALSYFVQDGGSTDNTLDILRKYEQKLAGWMSAPDRGQAHAINLGFARADGEIMGWLNSDDLLLPGSLEFVGDYFARHPDVDVVYGNRLLIDENGQEIGRWILPGHDCRALKWADFVPQETLFWRRELWDRVGANVDESFQFAMDWDLLVRFQEAEAKFAHLPRFLGAFRVHAEQKTSASINDLGFKEMTRIRNRLHGRTPGYTEIRAALAPFLFRHILHDILYRLRNRLGLKP